MRQMTAEQVVKKLRNRKFRRLRWADIYEKTRNGLTLWQLLCKATRLNRKDPKKYPLGGPRIGPLSNAHVQNV